MCPTSRTWLRFSKFSTFRTPLSLVYIAAQSVAGRTAFSFVSLYFSPLTFTRRVLLSYCLSLCIKTTAPDLSQARQIVSHFPSFRLCVLSPSPDRLTTNRARCAVAHLLVLCPLTFAAVLIRLSQPQLLRHRLPTVSPRPCAASPSPHLSHLSRHCIASPLPSQSLVNVGTNNHAAPTAWGCLSGIPTADAKFPPTFASSSNCCVCERVFSSSKETCTLHCSQLDPTPIKMIQVLKHLYQREQLNFTAGILAREEDCTIEGPVTESAILELLKAGKELELHELYTNWAIDSD